MRITMSVRAIVSVGALCVAGGYLLFSCLGPDGIPMVLERHRQIRELQQQNSELQLRIEQSKQRIGAFNESAEKRRQSARERLGKVRKDETVLVYPNR